MPKEGVIMAMRWRFRDAILVAGLLAMAAESTKADGYDIGSLASQFLQSKTQATVLEHDDVASPECQDKHFVKAAPVGSPTSHVSGKITERKWREIWTLTRCGTNVYYLIFFTEEGNGGAYYALVGPKPIEELQKYLAALSTTEPGSHEFWIYFDVGKFDIRADAARILDSVANAAKQSDGRKVVLTGHTDTTGSPARDQKLSEDRVRSARDYLSRQGIPVASITMISKGKTDLRVKTADQVSKQENRNVHIEIQ
ncbi:MAG TPA: OmpA family protein [Alphaproteobacteria bacterium]|nr:OmpA family protein [Alphaproteobacteria bacterium]